MPPPKKDPELMRAVGEKFLTVREAFYPGESQTGVGRKLKVGQSALSNWENGDRLLDVQIAIRLADDHDLTLDWFYRGRWGGLPGDVRRRLENTNRLIKARSR